MNGSFIANIETLGVYIHLFKYDLKINKLRIFINIRIIKLI